MRALAYSWSPMVGKPFDTFGCLFRFVDRPSFRTNHRLWRVSDYVLAREQVRKASSPRLRDCQPGSDELYCHNRPAAAR